MVPSRLETAWLGRIGYAEALRLQESLRARILAEEGPEALLLLEHDPVITLGRSADRGHILVDAAALARSGTAVYPTTRGGDVTWHGPGQLVAYPIVRLTRGVVAHIEAMAGSVIEVAARLGVPAEFRRDMPGVWVGNSKLCAFGVHVHRRVAIHGLAFNIAPSLAAYSAIVPCGLQGVGVTSLAALTRRGDLRLDELAAELAEALARRLGRDLIWRPRAEMTSLSRFARAASARPIP